MNADTPIAWTALPVGAAVESSDGEDIGHVTQVVADEQKDIFSGVAYRSGIMDSHRFVPADLIERITEDSVRLSITSAEADELDPYEG